MRVFAVALLFLVPALAGCASSDEGAATNSERVESASVDAAEQVDAPDSVGSGDAVRAFTWNGTLAIGPPGFLIQPTEPHIRMGAGPETWESDVFLGRLLGGAVTLTWTAEGLGDELELRVLVGTDREGWTELARASGASPLLVELDDEDGASDVARNVRLRVESADRGTGPLEAHTPADVEFTAESSFEVEGRWTVRVVR